MKQIRFLDAAVDEKTVEPNRGNLQANFNECRPPSGQRDVLAGFPYRTNLRPRASTRRERILPHWGLRA
jgi:hypothetical protein